MEPGVLLLHSQILPLAPFLSQTNPIHVLPIDLCKIDYNIILPSTPGSPKWSVFPSGFPTKTLYAPLLSPIHDTQHAHLILLQLGVYRFLK